MVDRSPIRARVRLRAIARLLAAAGAAAGFAAGASAQPSQGERVYNETCSACHATGKDKAPKFGDRKAWAPLIKEGQPELTADGWLGVRAMPPRGGNPKLTLEEFAGAAAFMARAAGATWKDPDAAMLKRIQAAEQRQLARRKAKAGA